MNLYYNYLFFGLILLLFVNLLPIIDAQWGGGRAGGIRWGGGRVGGIRWGGARWGGGGGWYG